MEEYTTFFITSKDGRQVEMAVVDEFDYGKRHYVVSAVVENDTISDEGQFIYRCRIREDGFDVEQITGKTEYEEVTKAYLEMEEESPGEPEGIAGSETGCS